MRHPWIQENGFVCDTQAIDMHMHINHGSPYDTTVGECHTADLEDLLRLSRAAGVEKQFCCTYASVLTTAVIEEENEYLHGLLDQYDSLYQWVVVDPRNKATLKQAEQLLNHKKCVGIKLHPPYHQYELAHHADDVCALAAQIGVPILIHPEKPPTYLLPIAERWPTVAFIAAHLGSRAFAKAIESAVHGNIYTDTSGIASSGNLILEETYHRVGADRILFGTDNYSPAFQRGRISFSALPLEDKEKILRDNALRLFARNLI